MNFRNAVAIGSERTCCMRILEQMCKGLRTMDRIMDRIINKADNSAIGAELTSHRSKLTFEVKGNLDN